jgi:hypothetical protein
LRVVRHLAVAGETPLLDRDGIARLGHPILQLPGRGAAPPPPRPRLGCRPIR